MGIANYNKIFIKLIKPPLVCAMANFYYWRKKISKRKNQNKYYNQLIKTVVILGMHHSGTSLTADILRILGVDMGYDLWLSENILFLRLNTKILETGGGSWENPPTKAAIAEISHQFQNKIKKLISLEESLLWGWKDPRTALLIDLYWPHLKNPRFIICQRNPKEITASFYRRNKNISIELIKIYNQRINSFLEKNQPRYITINFSDYRKNPSGVVDKIINFLDIKVNPEQKSKALNLIDPSLMHTL